ncbi:2Fe-2S ferredoxin, partial [Pseudomonas sp. FW305-130]
MNAPTLVADRVPLAKDAWYVGVASTQLRDAPVAITLQGAPIVLFRDADGQAQALHDRCPHRGVALSLGT